MTRQRFPFFPFLIVFSFLVIVCKFIIFVSSLKVILAVKVSVTPISFLEYNTYLLIESFRK